MTDVSRGRQAARVVVGLIWIVTAIVAVVVLAELGFESRAAYKEAAYIRAVRPVAPPSPRLDALSLAYQPFNVQYLHPQYLFFFPLDRQTRTTMGNPTASIDANGFREPGPAQADGRRLAVMLGGSAVFGEFATSNAKTITSYLNGLQDQYFFVNAGVSSWVSSQELMRLVLEIADLRPGLVIAYDGANDGALAGMSNPRSLVKYPPGTPEYFSTLDVLVDDSTASRWTRLGYLFPELELRLAKLRRAAVPTPDPTSADAAAAARVYLDNQARMALVAQAVGARFVSIFQPIAELHRHVDPLWGSRDGVRTLAVELRDLAQVEFQGHPLRQLAAFHDAQLRLGVDLGVLHVDRARHLGRRRHVVVRVFNQDTGGGAVVSARACSCPPSPSR